MLNFKRYQKNPVMDFKDRTWPNKEIENMVFRGSA